jgi:hypothetical protein
LPEEWLIERNQQVGAISRKPLSPPFVAVCRTFAVVFRNLRYIFVTVPDSDSNDEKHSSSDQHSDCVNEEGFREVLAERNARRKTKPEQTQNGQAGPFSAERQPLQIRDSHTQNWSTGGNFGRFLADR